MAETDAVEVDRVVPWLPAWLAYWHSDFNAVARTGYGVAWRDIQRGRVAMMPVPLNTVVALARRFFHWLRFGVASQSVYDQAVMRHGRTEYGRGYSQGVKDGYRDGHRDGMNAEGDALRRHIQRLREFPTDSDTSPSIQGGGNG